MSSSNAIVSLIAIDLDGSPRGYVGALSEAWAEVSRATAALYASRGFDEPWICYLALVDSKPVGTCGFTSPPRDGRVEIAYFSFPGFEGRGIATAMAAELVAITKRREPSMIVTAQTLPERNASHRILEKLGFRHVATLEHPEDGIVWEWRLMSGTSSAPDRVDGPHHRP